MVDPVAAQRVRDLETAGPGPNDDDREGGFTYGGWLAPYFDDPLWHTIGQLHAQAGGLLLGRKTYQTMAGYWPHVTDADNPWRRP